MGGNINSNNYWLELRYAAEHLKMHHKQQKTDSHMLTKIGY